MATSSINLVLKDTSTVIHFFVVKILSCAENTRKLFSRIKLINLNFSTERSRTSMSTENYFTVIFTQKFTRRKNTIFTKLNNFIRESHITLYQLNFVVGAERC